MTKIDIFSGFLGAGKTTLIKKLIGEAYQGEKLVLIENEFGQIGIDGGFLKEAGIQINELNSGCICCSLVGDFGKALKEVENTYHPDRILIEPSGVGKLSDVIRAVHEADLSDAVLNGFATVVDAVKCKMYMKNFGEFFNDQVENAGAIIFSHTKGVSDEKISSAIALIREKNPDATVVTTDWDELTGAQILNAIESKNTLAHLVHELEEDANEHHHHHQKDECDDPECSCHHHHHGECDDDECDCHHHEHHHHEHHHHEHHHHHNADGEHHHECEDPECSCHHHHHDSDGECDCHHHEHHHHHHHHHDADDVFTSFGVETGIKYSAEEILAILNAFTEDEGFGTVLRAKGIVSATDGKWIHFDYVPGEPDVRFGSAEVVGRICVIGANINKDKIADLFRV